MTKKQAFPEAVTKGIQNINARINDEGYLKQLEAWLGRKPDAFVASIMHLINTDHELAMCEPESLINAVALAAQLNLPLNTNMQYAYIGAYVDKRMDDKKKIHDVMVAQFQVGWRGYIQLAERTDKYLRINVTDVRAGELVNYDRLSGDCVFEWVADESKRKTLEVIGYVSYFKLKSQFEKMLYWTREEILQHGNKFSKTFTNPQMGWQKNEDGMCRKTLLKMLLSGYGPKSAEMAIAVAADQSAVEGLDNGGQFNYIDNPMNDEPVKAEVIKRANKAKKSVDNVAGLLEGKKTIKEVRKRRNSAAKS